MSEADNERNNPRREGSLDAPTRHPIDWKNPDYYNQTAIDAELERVFDVCHGCRRCFNLCQSFPTLFDLVDNTDSGEVDGVDKAAYKEVVDNCYLCDMCYMSKCPYVPPHPWNIDFPHLMLRAKAAGFRRDGASVRDRLLSSTDAVGRLATIPVVVQAVNAVNHSMAGRAALEKTLNIHREAYVPRYDSRTLRKRVAKNPQPGSAGDAPAQPTASRLSGTTGQVAVFTTCYGNRNEPRIGQDLLAVFRHNGIEVRLTPQEVCCGMPKLELGDLDSVSKLADANIPVLADLVDDGWDIVAPIPSCVLMFKQELPLMFPDDANVKKVQAAFFDPFEYLMLRHRSGALRTDFARPLGKVAYHVPCHLRVQNIGSKTRDLLSLVPDTQVETVERCAGHDGTYAVKKEFHDSAMKIARPVVRKIQGAKADFYSSDCPLAGHHIGQGIDGDSTATSTPVHPLTLLAMAYGLTAN